jgi:hypothetical protein
VYVGIRIFTVDITNDEAYSFHNVKHFWYAEFLCTGNSHWLNSLWMKICVLLGLEEVYHLRLFSFFSFVAFAALVVKFTDLLNHSALRWLTCCLMLLSPYTLDYFVLARGYASGMMLEFLSLLLFFRCLRTEKRVFAFAALLAACLSAVANFSFLYFLVAFVGVYFYHFYFREKKSFFKIKHFYSDLFVVISTLIPVLLALRFITRCSNDYIGAGSGSVTGIFEGLMNGNLGIRNFTGSILSVQLGSIAAVLLLITLLYGILRVKKHNSDLYFYSSVLILLSFVLILTGRWLVNGVYPEGRSALFLFPVAALNVVLFLNTVTFKTRHLLCYAGGFLLVLNFILKINFQSVFDFTEQAGSEKVFKSLDAAGAKKVALCGEVYGVYINYYQAKEKPEFIFDGYLLNKQEGNPELISGTDHLVENISNTTGSPETRVGKWVSRDSIPGSRLIIYKLGAQ